MSKGKRDTVSRILWKEVDEDDFFSHRVIGAVGLMQSIIAKQAIVLRKVKLDFILHTSQEEIEFIAECVADYSEPLSVKKSKETSYEDELYGNDFRLSEVAELVVERVQRKLQFQEKFRKILQEKRTVTGG